MWKLAVWRTCLLGLQGLHEPDKEHDCCQGRRADPAGSGAGGVHHDFQPVTVVVTDVDRQGQKQQADERKYNNGVP